MVFQVRRRSSGFSFEEPIRGTFGDFGDQVGGEMIDLNLGNWACLENSWSGSSEKSLSSVISTPSTAVSKRMKAPTTRRCQVEGCNLDLSFAKDYHRKHRVCDYHSKSSQVIVQGLVRRFCQQCSRFHGLLEFDLNKRSCRKRLSDHNARRRKPHQERIGFNASWIPTSSFYGQSPDTYNQMAYTISMHANHSNGFLAPNDSAASGLKDETSATDFRRAFSLLSTNYWGSCEPESIPFGIPFGNTMNASRMNMPQTAIHAVPLCSFPSSEYYLDGQPSTYPRIHSLTSGSSEIGENEGFQIAKPSYGRDFYFSPLHY